MVFILLKYGDACLLGQRLSGAKAKLGLTGPPALPSQCCHKPPRQAAREAASSSQRCLSCSHDFRCVPGVFRLLM